MSSDRCRSAFKALLSPMPHCIPPRVWIAPAKPTTTLIPVTLARVVASPAPASCSESPSRPTITTAISRKGKATLPFFLSRHFTPTECYPTEEIEPARSISVSLHTPTGRDKHSAPTCAAPEESVITRLMASEATVGAERDICSFNSSRSGDPDPDGQRAMLAMVRGVV